MPVKSMLGRRVFPQAVKSSMLNSDTASKDGRRDAWIYIEGSRGSSKTASLRGMFVSPVGSEFAMGAPIGLTCRRMRTRAIGGVSVALHSLPAYTVKITAEPNDSDLAALKRRAGSDEPVEFPRRVSDVFGKNLTNGSGVGRDHGTHYRNLLNLIDHDEPLSKPNTPASHSL